MTRMLDHYYETATWEGAPYEGDRPVSLDRMAAVLGVHHGTPYTWSYRDALPAHDGVIGRSRFWWESKILRWHHQRNTVGGRPPKPEGEPRLQRVA
jgi:hypothetical protein